MYSGQKELRLVVTLQVKVIATVNKESEVSAPSEQCENCMKGDLASHLSYGVADSGISIPIDMLQ